MRSSRLVTSLVLLTVVAQAAFAAGPRLLAPGVVSTGDSESHATLSPDGATLYVLKPTPDFAHWTVVSAARQGKAWAELEVAWFSGRFDDGDVSLAPDGRTIYFISNRPDSGDVARRDTDLFHLRVAARGRVLGRAQRRDDRGIHDRPRSQQHPPLLEQAVDLGEDRFGQTVLLEQMAKPQNRRLVRNDVVAELDAGKPTPRLDVVDRAFRLGVREVEPLLEKVDAQHLLQSQRLPPAARLGVVRLNPRQQASARARKPTSPAA